MSKMAELSYEIDSQYDGTEGIDLKAVRRYYKRKNKKGDSVWTLRK